MKINLFKGQEIKLDKKSFGEVCLCEREASTMTNTNNKANKSNK